MHSTRRYTVMMENAALDMTCTIPQCTQAHYAKQMCLAHYMQKYRGGTPGRIRERNNKPSSTCTVDGCAKPYTARGMCMMHYQRHRRAGSVN